MDLGKVIRRSVLSALLAVLVTGIHLVAQQAPAKESMLEIHKLAIPDKAWALEVALPTGSSIEGPKFLNSELLQGRELIVFNVAPKDGWHISVSMEKAAAGVDAKTARDEYGKKMIKGPLRIEEIKKYEMNDGAVWEHINKDPLIREMNTGKVAVYKVLSYFLLHDSYLIEVSLRKLSYKSPDQKYFDSIPTSIKIVPIGNGSQAEIPDISARTYSLSQYGSFTLPIPASWRSSVRESATLPPMVVLRPENGESFEITIVPHRGPAGEGMIFTPDDLKQFANAALSQMYPEAEKEEVPIREFKGVDGPGYYFTVVNKAKDPDGYPFLLFANVGFGDVFLSAAVCYRDKESEVARSAIKMLQEIRREKDE